MHRICDLRCKINPRLGRKYDVVVYGCALNLKMQLYRISYGFYVIFYSLCDARKIPIPLAYAVFTPI